MTWTIIIGGVCAAWLVYEYRTAPTIDSLDGRTGNECQCHGTNGIVSYHDGSLRRATEGKSNGRVLMGNGGDSGGFRARRVNGVDCVVRHGTTWTVGIAKGGQQWLFESPGQFGIRKRVAQLATAGHLTWHDAANINAFLKVEEMQTCKKAK